ncbi:GNAT family N-acetyltransferase [Lysinibacillus endophyticus]|uniref:GNAT family N-acetyltransferase n=1 Tax=Ureibacillus endophyticus TaxID=1978490 RepID=A0A494Z8U0_9BACL|nr:GNAT family N-acetyltransferase [Lysinibacillus endophyticus]MCP1143418.1 GNAT family N-acetyltransferase [Lysinibacillus endophyticus]RKQ19043.1 GNAT family N-acetyltransferase [Lysinibacillus endophyticus]
MNFSIITASFPIDSETYKEIKALCDDACKIDQYNYSVLLNLPISQNTNVRGFFVLAYDDDKDELVGVSSAVDQMGLNTYEWSILVAPMYREIGIDEALLKVLGDGLHQRGAEGELSLVIQNDKYRRKFVEKYGYTYSFSEATFEAKPQIFDENDRIYIRPYFEATDKERLIEIYGEAFGDLMEESLELISYNTTTEGRILWIALLDDKIAGTVTSVKEGDVQWITALAVHPDFQGQGVATALLNWVKDFALRNGENLIMLEVEIENERALAVYERAGFIKSMQVDYFVYNG